MITAEPWSGPLFRARLTAKAAAPARARARSADWAQERRALRSLAVSAGGTSSKPGAGAGKAASAPSRPVAPSGASAPSRPVAPSPAPAPKPRSVPRKRAPGGIPLPRLNPRSIAPEHLSMHALRPEISALTKWLRAVAGIAETRKLTRHERHFVGLIKMRRDACRRLAGTVV